MINIKYFKVYFVLFISLYLLGCTSRPFNIGKLDLNSRDFYLNVYIIMTKAEKNLYFSLPRENRREFEESFWKIRDPNPYSDENEFKKMYLERVEEARQKFKSDGPGYFGDRGQVYILLGPPDELYDRPSNQSYFSSQIWIYRSLEMRVQFVDRSGTGKHEMYPVNHRVFHYMNVARHHITGLGAKSRLNIKTDFEDNLVLIKVKTESLTFEEVNEKMQYSLEIEYFSSGKSLMKKEVKGEVKEDGDKGITEYIEISIPVKEYIKKNRYLYIFIFDLYGRRSGGKLITGGKK